MNRAERKWEREALDKKRRVVVEEWETGKICSSEFLERINELYGWK